MATHYVDSAYREPMPPRGGYRYAPRRDALTGEPIRSDTIHKRVASARLDHQPTRAQYVVGWRADITAQPLRLHTAQVETGGEAPGAGLGGHAFTHQFAQYLARVKPVLLAQADAEARYWWLSDYGQQRVQRRFHARYGVMTGRVAWRAAIAVASGYLAVGDVMRETGHTAGWVARMCVLAAQFAREPALSASPAASRS